MPSSWRPGVLSNRAHPINSSKNGEISACGDNLLNKRYFQIVVPILSVFGVDHQAALRTFGLEATIKF
jgi:iron complex outermembrane receptor protein